MAIDPEVKHLLAQENWHEERKRLRALILGCGLEERVKWGKLCYAHNDANVAIIYGMKAYCAIGFFKGSLLEDEDEVLVQPGKHSQAMRQLRFRSIAEIEDRADLIIRFIKRAVQAEKDGLEVDFTEKDNLDYPAELQDALDDDPDLAQAFEGLTPGRQRGYVLHICDAKQAETRTRRIEKSRPRILQGKGINER